ncbi:MAG: hypothetical protein LBC64_02960 [Fibromonadaceae bacterium]|jgi:hypothetical protein|nr:hypothetical protein [Fibromonadaceae bacterium]
MRKSISKLALAAAFGLALSFTLSCSSDDDDVGGGDGGWYNPNDENSRCQGGVVEAKCGDNEWYNSAKYFCTSDYDEFSNIYYYTITWEQYHEQMDEQMKQLGYARCDNAFGYDDLNDENVRCQGGVREYKCGDEWINTAKYTCAGDYDEFSNIHYYTITLEQWYEQNGYVRCK